MALISRTTVLRVAIPAVIVAVVLGMSFAISTVARDRNHEPTPHKCGYGYDQQDSDENQDQENGDVASAQTSPNVGNSAGHDLSKNKDKDRDKDRCEDEPDAPDGPDDSGGGTAASVLTASPSGTG